MLQHFKTKHVPSLVRNLSKCTLCGFGLFFFSPHSVVHITANLCGYGQLRKFSAISASMLKLFFYRPGSLKQLYFWSQVLLRQQSPCEPTTNQQGKLLKQEKSLIVQPKILRQKSSKQHFLSIKCFCAPIKEHM